MQIEMFEAKDGDSISGRPELHLRVLSDRLPDLPRVLLQLTPEQQTIWRKYQPRPTGSWPADTTKESHGFKYDDEWHFARQPFVRD